MLEFAGKMNLYLAGDRLLRMLMTPDDRIIPCKGENAGN